MAVGGNGANTPVLLSDLLEVVYYGREATHVQNGLNVRHYFCNQVGTAGATLGQVATTASSLTFANYKNLMSTAASFWGVSARRVWPRPVTAIAWTDTDRGAGTIAGDTLPRQTCGVIGFTTNFAGQKYRGRAYTMFPGENANDAGGVPTQAYVDSLTALAANLLSTLVVNGPNGIQLTPILWHRNDGVQPSFTAIVGALARKIWGTQRRRGDYGRLNIAPF